jgi:hypothetical protein
MASEAKWKRGKDGSREAGDWYLGERERGGNIPVRQKRSIRATLLFIGNGRKMREILRMEGPSVDIMKKVILGEEDGKT